MMSGFSLEKDEPENCMYLLQVEPGLYSETCSTSHDRNQLIDIKVEVTDIKVEEVTDVKVEGVTDVQEEEDPLQIAFPAMKAEQENDMKRQPKHTAELPCFCVKCSSPLHSLKGCQHIRVEDRSYSCAACNASFTEQDKLETHQRIHSHNLPYFCDVCNISFSEQDNMKIHQRIHSGMLPYFCSVCKKSFKHLCSLKKHQHIHAKEHSYSCGVCNISFSEQDNLKIH